MVAAAVACLSIVGLSVAADVNASIRKDISIPAQQLGPALEMFSKEADVHLVYFSEDLKAIQTKGVTGELTTTEALTKLLEGTNLAYSYLDEKTLTILPVGSNNKRDEQRRSAWNSQHCPRLSSNRSDHATSLNQTASERAPDCVESYFQENQALAARIASAGDAPARNSDGESSLNEDSTPPRQLSEVVVTAQKIEERIQDVPLPVAVLSTDALVESNQTKLSDYYMKVPGLSIAPGTFQTQNLSIRGLTTGGGAATVAVTVDDVPFSTGTNAVPDFDPGDLARVEVLRGPQGALYGSSGMGGLVKFVTVDPSTKAFTGRVEAGADSVRNGDSLGHTVRGSFNVPLNDVLALRASAFTRKDPGYLDNPVLHLNGVNEERVSGGHVALLWKPSESFSAKLSALY